MDALTELSLAMGLLLFCIIVAKGLSAGWFQITLKKPIDVRMSEPEPTDLAVRALRRQHRTLRAGYQRGYRR